MLAGDQGKPPPIDWSKGTVVVEVDASWGSIGPIGSSYKIEIGRDKSGKAIEITAWHPTGPLMVQYCYFCHGLTFSGGGPISFSPFGSDVAKILSVFYTAIPEKNVKGGDIVVFSDKTGTTHSCIIVTPFFNNDGTLDLTKTKVNTKNGLNAAVEMTLKALTEIYEVATLDYYTRK